MTTKTDAILKLEQLLSSYETKLEKAQKNYHTYFDSFLKMYNLSYSRNFYYLDTDFYYRSEHNTDKDIINDLMKTIYSVLKNVKTWQLKVYELKFCLEYLRDGKTGLDRFNSMNWNLKEHETLLKMQNEYFYNTLIKEDRIAPEFLPNKFQFDAKLLQPIKFDEAQIKALLKDLVNYSDKEIFRGDGLDSSDNAKELHPLIAEVQSYLIDSLGTNYRETTNATKKAEYLDVCLNKIIDAKIKNPHGKKKIYLINGVKNNLIDSVNFILSGLGFPKDEIQKIYNILKK